MKLFAGRYGENGSILVFVIWILLILSLFSVSLGYSVRQVLRLVQNMDVRNNLRYIAESGVAKALNVLRQKELGPEVDHLNSRWANSPGDFREIPVGEGRFSVLYSEEKDDSPGEKNDELSALSYGIVDEERKLNLNKEKARHVWTRLFQYGGGVSREEAAALVAAIGDWQDADSFENDQGAESRYYQALQPSYSAKNSDLDTLEELIFVKGMTPELYRRMLPFMTLDSDRAVNINTVSPQILLAGGFGPSLVQKIMMFRLGRDRAANTKDDGVFSNLATLAADLDASLGLNDAEKQSFEQYATSGALTISSQVFTIRCQSRLNHRKETLTVTCVADRKGNIKRWREEFGVAENESSPAVPNNELN